VNPYQEFNRRTPDAVLAGEILVFNGTYEVRSISGLSHFAVANTAARTGHPEVALGEAQQAETLAPDLMMPHSMLAQLYARQHRPADAQREYEAALHLYQTTYGDFARRTPPPENPLPPTVATAQPPAK
jgi:tetratricopeptide (TPR) repeat protein